MPVSRSAFLRMSFALMAAAGCMSCAKVGPDYRRPALNVPPAFRGTPDTQPAQAHLANNWWELFQDPDLTSLEEHAIAANPDLRAAMERVAEARAATQIVQSQFYPTITLDPAATWGLGSSGGGGGGGGGGVVGNTGLRIPFDLAYEIDLWGRVSRSVEAANANVRSAADQYGVVMQTLEADVAQNYVNLRSLEKQDEILKRNVALFEQQLNLTQQKKAAGIVGGLDVAQVQAQLDQAVTERLDIARQRTDTEHALAILTGVPPEQFSVGAPTVEMVIPEVPLGLPADLLRNRPDVASAEQSLVAANANVGVAVANFYPTVRLTGAAGFENASIQKALDYQNVLLSFGPSVSLPLFEGGALQGNLDQARARYRELAASYASALLAALRDVEVSLTDVRSRSASLVAQQKAVASSKEYLRLAQLEYGQGIISLLQLIDADKTELTAEQQEENLRANRLLSTLLLIKAVGGGWTPADPVPAPANASQSPSPTPQAATQPTTP